MRSISCARCHETLGEVLLCKQKQAAEQLRAEEAESRCREAAVAAEQHAAQLDELRAAHSERTAELIRACSAETEALQVALSEFQECKVELAAGKSAVEGELNSALKDLKKKGVARQRDEKASAVAAALAEKAQAQHSKYTRSSLRGQRLRTRS